MPFRGAPRPLTVLIVEDRPDVADSIVLFLRLVGGYDTHLAYDGEAGLAAAARLRPDAIVCDLGLPKKNGFTVAEGVCRRLPVKPLLVAVSAYTDEAIRGRARWAGFDHFLAKPADPWAIDALLRRHAAGAAPAGEPVPAGR